jgi:hypothetical protein
MSQVDDAVQDAQTKLREVVAPRFLEIGKCVAELLATLPVSPRAQAMEVGGEAEDTLTAVRGYLECFLLEVIPEAIKTALAGAAFRAKKN